MSKSRGRTSRGCRLSEQKMKRWRRSWWREDHLLDRPMLSAGPTPPFPTQDRLRKPRTRFPPTRWMVNPISTSRPWRLSPWIRPADTFSPTLSWKLHCQSGKASTGTGMKVPPTQTSIWMSTPPIWVYTHRTMQWCAECFPHPWREEPSAGSPNFHPTPLIASSHLCRSSRPNLLQAGRTTWPPSPWLAFARRRENRWEPS